jgi:putative phosphoesterase
MRIGLISDTHIPTAGRELWPQVYEALRGVDLIMHAGDLHDPVVLDWLEPLAPVLAVSGNGDYGGWQRTVPPSDPRLRESRVLALDGEATGGRPLRIGLVHDLPLPEAPPLRTLEGLMDHFFGGPVDVIVRGSTHAAEITTIRGVLIVNPGSPTFPNHQSVRLGTLGYLDIGNGRVEPSLLQLE